MATTGRVVGEQQMVQLVLGVEEGPRLLGVARAAVGQHADVAAGAEAALAGVVDDDHVDLGILLPVQQGGDHDLAHGLGQGVQRLGPVQRQPADVFLNADKDFGLVVHGG
jgi:hypothetical protein